MSRFSSDSDSPLRGAAEVNPQVNPRPGAEAFAGKGSDRGTGAPSPSPLGGGYSGGAYAAAGERPPPNPTGGEAPDERATAFPGGIGQAIKERLAAVQKLLLEMAEYGNHLVRVKIDRALIGVRTALIWAAVGVVAAVAGISALVYATVLLLSGIAGGLSILFRGHLWLGNLVTGLVVLAVALLGAVLAGRSLIGKSQRALHAKYEALKKAQRQHFGRDVTTAARAGSPQTPAHPAEAN